MCRCFEKEKNMIRLFRIKSTHFILTLLMSFSFDTYSQCNGSLLLCNKKYDEVAYLTTHNAFNSAQDNFSLPNHNFNIATQLNDGVRGLMIDVYDYFGTPTVYHSSYLLGTEPLQTYLSDIKSFLDNNPNEVVTIILECNISANDIESEVDQAGLLNYLYTHTLNTTWPTLQTIISNNTRLVIFSDQNDAGINQGWYHYMWDHMVETHYSANSINDLNCDFNRGDSINDLFILNHFVTSITGTGSETESTTANSNPYFINRALQCQQEKNKFPNFVTVDFYELGNCFDVVNQLNGITTAFQSNIQKKQLNIYPNPFNDKTIIELPGSEGYQLNLFDIMGNRLKSIEHVTDRSIELIRDKLVPGIYFIQLISDGKAYKKKLIIE